MAQWFEWHWCGPWLILALLAGCGGSSGGSGGPAADGDDSSGSGSGAATSEARSEALFLTYPIIWLQVGETFSYLPGLALDADGAEFTATGLPAGATLDTATGHLQWVPNAAEVGDHAISLSVALEGTIYTQDFTLSVFGVAQTVEESITAAGGTLAASGLVSIEVPSGAVEQLTTFRVDALSDAPDLEATTGYAMVGPLLRIEAEDAAGTAVETFAEPLRVTLHYDPEALPGGVDAAELNAFLVDGNLQQLMLHIESTVDDINHTVTFETPHLTDWALGYPSRLLYTYMVDDGRFYVYHRDPSDLDAAMSYSEKVLAAAQQAEAVARDAGFEIPDSDTVSIRIHDEAGPNGHYDFLSGIIYVDDTLDDDHIKTTTAHEYFHAVQDQYYAMSAANFTGLMWWYESTSPWYETQIDSDILTEKINSAAAGYLRTPLFSAKRDDAYPKGTLIEYLELLSPGIVLATFEGNSVINSVTGLIDQRVDLDAVYPDYVNWALERYGPGSGTATIDGALLVRENGEATFFDMYSERGVVQTSTDRVNFLAPDEQSGILQLTTLDRSAKEAYRAFIYRLRPDDATTKTVRAKFTKSGGMASDQPYLLALDEDGNQVSLQAVTPNDESFHRVRGFGTGDSDRVATLYLIYTDRSSGSEGRYRWQIEVVEQPPLADIEITLPADRYDASEIRPLQPEQFEAPTIAVDLEADPEASGYALTFWGLNSDASEFKTGWQVHNIERNIRPVTYADPEVGEFNTAALFPGFEELYAPPLNEFSNFLVWALGCDADTGGGCSGRGSQVVRYLDGDVDFDFTIEPARFTPAHFDSVQSQFVETTPVTLTLTVSNESSVPVVLNSLEWAIGEGAQKRNITLRSAQQSAALQVGPGEVGSLTFNEVQAQVGTAQYGTAQPSRIYIQVDNCTNGDYLTDCGMTDGTDAPAAAFWGNTYSNSTSVQVLAPPD